MSEHPAEYELIPGHVALTATGEPPIKLTVEKNSRGYTYEASVRAATVEAAFDLLHAAMAGLAARYGGAE